MTGKAGAILLASTPVSRAAKVLSHPLRGWILGELASSEEMLSPMLLMQRAEAREMHAPLGNVSYHVRQLLAHRMVRQVATKQRRGAVEHFYRPTEPALRLLQAAEAWQRALNGHE